MRTKDLRQKLRRELLFGLIPKTLKGTFFCGKVAVNCEPSAGYVQAHTVKSAFHVLQHKSFLRDQGVLTLEAVQKFYETVSGNVTFNGWKMTMVEKDLLDFCSPGRTSGTVYQPVVIIKPANISHGNHAVALKEYSNDKKTLTLTLNDSAAKSGVTILKAGNRKPTRSNHCIIQKYYKT